MVTTEIAKRKSGRSLVVLLFSEHEVKSGLIETWKRFSTNDTAHVFRVGSAQPKNQLSADNEHSFEKLLACTTTENSDSIRRKPAISLALTTSRPPPRTFSKTTRPPPTTRPNTTSGPKLRPIFRKKEIREKEEIQLSDIPLKSEDKTILSEKNIGNPVSDLLGLVMRQSLQSDFYYIRLYRQIPYMYLLG
ncbi:unnamed protein product [Cylicostephanus goldi]|uniref:Uncharacterized protein n=1 Tax=Cylicostephanus goldi TaxID=71465 RepID=A0A3P6R4L0_CYLGO|nr:unnamed protein product [Cylicostephanus goldi]